VLPRGAQRGLIVIALRLGRPHVAIPTLCFWAAISSPMQRWRGTQGVSRQLGYGPWSES